MIKKIVNKLTSPFELIFFKFKWRRKNKHNFTTASSVFPIHLVDVGNFSYGPIHVYSYGEANSGLRIGNLCSIALDVKFILGGNHYTNRIFTYPITPMLTGKDLGCFSKGKIVIGHDCWIGFGAMVLSGVTLGNGCVVAAGSIVTTSFPSFSIIGGIPAKLIRMRFSKDIIEKLEINKLIYEFSREKYISNLVEIEKNLQIENIDTSINKLMSKTI